MLDPQAFESLTGFRSEGPTPTDVERAGGQGKRRALLILASVCLVYVGLAWWIL